MVDIAMCGDAKCPSRETCYRFKAKPGDLQTYGHFGRYEAEKKCEYFWPFESRSQLRRLNASLE